MISGKLQAQPVIFAIIGCFLITWVGEAASLKGFQDLLSFVFITKVVTTLVTLTGMNTYFANKTFRDPSARTRISDSMMASGFDLRKGFVFNEDEVDKKKKEEGK